MGESWRFSRRNPVKFGFLGLHFLQRYQWHKPLLLTTVDIGFDSRRY
jgi:hypothetical protein